MKWVVVCVLVFIQTLFAESLLATWKPNSEKDLAGYKLYYGTASGQYDNILTLAGQRDHYKIDDLESCVEYFAVLTAYDFIGNESQFSKQVSCITSGCDTIIFIPKYDRNSDGMIDLLDIIMQFDDPVDLNDDGFNDILDLIIIIDEMEVTPYVPEQR